MVETGTSGLTKDTIAMAAMRMRLKVDLLNILYSWVRFIGLISSLGKRLFNRKLKRCSSFAHFVAEFVVDPSAHPCLDRLLARLARQHGHKCR